MYSDTCVNEMNCLTSRIVHEIYRLVESWQEAKLAEFRDFNRDAHQTSRRLRIWVNALSLTPLR
ncbi:MAG: hypothetical protein M1378_07750, partial [Bacteroidetes bacterium]|nr:hypothetical protein [Bacteroidota bacterium]